MKIKLKRMEITILKNLLRAQLFISDYNYKDSILTLFQSKNDLENWRQKCFFPEAPKVLFFFFFFF